MKSISTNTRKIGADMTNGLLWAAFSIIVLLSVMQLYTSVRVNMLHQEAVRSIAHVASNMSLVIRQSNTIDTDVDRMGQAVSDAYAEMPFSMIRYPAIYTNASPAARHSYGLGLFFPPNPQAKAVCYKLLGNLPNGTTTVESGQFGENYDIMGRCDRASPYVIVYYVR